MSAGLCPTNRVKGNTAAKAAINAEAVIVFMYPVLLALLWMQAISGFHDGHPPSLGFSVASRLPLESLVKFAKSFRGLDVAPCPSRDVLLFVEGELPPDFRGRAEHERAGRNFHPNRDQRVCPDEGPCADFHIVENNSAHPDEHFIVDLASVDDGAVADGYKLAHSCGIIRVEMDDCIVLNVRTRTDNDAVDVAAQDGPVPHARLFFDRDVANYHRAGDNPSA